MKTSLIIITSAIYVMNKLEKVFERDIDLYILNKFFNDKEFKNIFLNVLGLECYLVKDFIHSYSDENGESDITVILENKDERVGLLIEDKISAIAMPNQYERYLKRGEKLVQDGLFDRFFVFIIAPESYLKENAEASKYDYKISYETILEHIKDDYFGTELIKEAISEKKKGYSVIENKTVTKFWDRYYKLVESRYPALNIHKHKGARGSNALWPIFLTPIDNVQIIHKSNKGCVDLSFTSLAEYYYEILDIIEDKLNQNMSLQKTGKSLAIRINTPVIDFHDDFDKQVEDTIECLEAVNKLIKLIRNINCNKILNIGSSISK